MGRALPTDDLDRQHEADLPFDGEDERDVSHLAEPGAL